MKKRLSLLLILVSLAAFTTGKQAEASTDWVVDFENTLASCADSFNAGANEGALDGYDAYDIKQPTPPTGPYVQMFTVVENYSLTKDIRSPLELLVPKTWEITLVAYDPVGLTGTNLITWGTLPRPLDEPGNEPLLIDYGTDATRTTSVATIDMSAQNSYSFDVTNVSGTYRYIDFEVYLVPELSTLTLLGLGAAALLRKRRIIRRSF